MNIRYATPADIDELARIEAASFPPAEAASKASITRRVQAFPECFWLLEEDGRIIAFINGMATDEADLRDIMFDDAHMHRRDGQWQMLFSVATDPAYRLRGMASQVMQRVIADSRTRGRKGIVLTCKEALLPFYARFGYINEGVSQSDHGGARWYQMRMTF